jgi:hypothetical protein
MLSYSRFQAMRWRSRHLELSCHLLVAPTLLPGISVTKDLLRLAGVPQETIDKAERDISRAVSTGVTSATRLGVSTATLGVVKIDKKLKCVKIFRKKICR